MKEKILDALKLLFPLMLNPTNNFGLQSKRNQLSRINRILTGIILIPSITLFYHLLSNPHQYDFPSSMALLLLTFPLIVTLMSLIFLHPIGAKFRLAIQETYNKANSEILLYLDKIIKKNDVNLLSTREQNFIEEFCAQKSLCHRSGVIVNLDEQPFILSIFFNNKNIYFCDIIDNNTPDVISAIERSLIKLGSIRNKLVQQKGISENILRLILITTHEKQALEKTIDDHIKTRSVAGSYFEIVFTKIS